MTMRRRPVLSALGLSAATALSAWRVAAVGGSAAGLLAPARAAAQPARSGSDPFRVGVDRSLMDSGLAPALARAFGIDTGIAVKLVAGPARPLLDALERGELDAALTNAPDVEQRLVQQGFAHDRQPIAVGEFVLVGPSPPKPAKGQAAAAVATDAAAALAALQRTALAQPGTVAFLSAGDGSGLHLAEQALWRRAGIAPAGPWYVMADAGSPLIAQARARAAYALVERAAWVAQGGAPLVLRAGGDPQLAEPIHVMRAFASRHPAGKLFVAWVAGARGQRVVAAQKYLGKARAG